MSLGVDQSVGEGCVEFRRPFTLGETRRPRRLTAENENQFPTTQANQSANSLQINFTQGWDAS